LFRIVEMADVSSCFRRSGIRDQGSGVREQGERVFDRWRRERQRAESIEAGVRSQKAEGGGQERL
jgi:hypothetical protein